MISTNEAQTEPQNLSRAADMVIWQIENSIANGEFENNKPLPPERQLVERYNSSRTVVREAIATLGQQGLLEIKPRYRPVVRKPDFATALGLVSGVVRNLLQNATGVRNLYEGRVVLECALVRQATTDADHNDISNLKDALTRNEAAIHDSMAFYDTDEAFHRVLFTIGKNPIFPAIHTSIRDWLAPYWLKMDRSPERNALIFAQHKSIYDCVLERDPDRAEKAMRRHLKTSWEHVRETFGFEDIDNLNK